MAAAKTGTMADTGNETGIEEVRSHIASSSYLVELAAPRNQSRMHVRERAWVLSGWRSCKAPLGSSSRKCSRCRERIRRHVLTMIRKRRLARGSL